MTGETMQSLEDLIRHAGEGWMYDWFGQSKQSGSLDEYLAKILQRVTTRAAELLGSRAPRLSAEMLIGEYKRAPHKVQAFLQALGKTNSPDMLIMVWRILQGMEIDGIDMAYRLNHDFKLSVRLRSPYDEGVEEYTSTNIDDAALLHHLGIMKMGDQPVFDGFYASRI